MIWNRNLKRFWNVNFGVLKLNMSLFILNLPGFEPGSFTFQPNHLGTWDITSNIEALYLGRARKFLLADVFAREKKMSSPSLRNNCGDPLDGNFARQTCYSVMIYSSVLSLHEISNKNYHKRIWLSTTNREYQMIVTAFIASAGNISHSRSLFKWMVIW